MRNLLKLLSIEKIASGILELVHQYYWRCAYKFVAENMLAETIARSDLDPKAGLDRLTKIRDDMVDKIYKMMVFLASTLVIIFFVRRGVIDVPSLVSIKFSGKVGNIYFVFTFLTLGNLISLLYAPAMLRMFVAEHAIKMLLRLDGRNSLTPLDHMQYRYFTYVYSNVYYATKKHNENLAIYLCKILHYFVIVFIPLMYMSFYVWVLVDCIFWINAQKPGADSISTSEQAYFVYILATLNLITLPVYAASFLPVPSARVTDAELEDATRTAAYHLWLRSGCRPNNEKFHWEAARNYVMLRGIRRRDAARRAVVGLKN